MDEEKNTQIFYDDETDELTSRRNAILKMAHRQFSGEKLYNIIVFLNLFFVDSIALIVYALGSFELFIIQGFIIASFVYSIRATLMSRILPIYCHVYNVLQFLILTLLAPINDNFYNIYCLVVSVILLPITIYYYFVSNKTKEYINHTLLIVEKENFKKYMAEKKGHVL